MRFEKQQRHLLISLLKNYTKYELILTVNDCYFKKESEKSWMECSILAENRMITWQISL